MIKKAVLLTLDGKIIDVLDVLTFNNEEQYNKYKVEAQDNKESYLKEQKKEKKEFESVVNHNFIELNLKNKLLELEIKLLKGDIDEEIYIEKKAQLTDELRALEGEK